MKTYWAPGRKFSDYHGVALRYTSKEAAEDRMKQPNFPKEEGTRAELCDSCHVYHIVRGE